jgi:hypothetical protein
LTGKYSDITLRKQVAPKVSSDLWRASDFQKR